MITVRIGSEERDCPIDPNWVNQQINGFRKDGVTPCVRVMIKTAGVDFTLLSQGCGGGAGMGRTLSSDEQAVLALWNKLDLGSADFPVGKLVAFLQQIGCR